MFAFDELSEITFWGGKLLTGMDFSTKGSVAKEGVLICFECFLH